LPITALVGFLIGVVLSYLSALQLKTFGADVFIINILGIGIVRELGPVLVAVLVAGRSGSAMTAQLGVMRVTEEIDALAAMGVSRSLRLVLPKVVALVAAMPLLVLWTSAAALFGGMVAASFQLDMSYRLLSRHAAACGADRQSVHRSRQRCRFRSRDRTGRLSFRPVRAAQYREPVGEHHQIRGERDHLRHSGRCRVRHRHASYRNAGMNAPVIHIEGLVTRFGANVVHQDIDLDVAAGEVLALVGGSGSGKTTLLRELIGLLRPDAGRISLFGQSLFSGDVLADRSLRRRFGVLFQNGALFSALNVFENIAFPLRESGWLDRPTIKRSGHAEAGDGRTGAATCLADALRTVRRNGEARGAGACAVART
jgi:ABC-type multidrug transport system fused ATPase/permease subunit